MPTARNYRTQILVGLCFIAVAAIAILCIFMFGGPMEGVALLSLILIIQSYVLLRWIQIYRTLRSGERDY